jgi:acetyltransferase
VALSVYSSSLQAMYETPIFAGELPGAAECGPWLRALRQGGVERLDAAQLARLFSAYGLDWQPGLSAAFSLRCQADPTFGPLLVLGAGDDAERVYGDFTAALPPLTSTLALRMIERLRAHQLLDANGMEGLVLLLVRFSRLVSELPVLGAMRLRLALPEGAICHAEVEMQPLSRPESEWPRCVVRPYPSQYVQEIALRDGSTALLRPIRPEDETLIVDFHSDLSERSVYLRYLQFLQLEERILHDRLARVCFNDYDRELALVVVQEGRILGVGRLQQDPLRAEPEAEVAFLVRDSAQGRGVGGALVQQIVGVAQAEGIQRLTAELLASNSAMRNLLERVGFSLRPSSDGSTLLGRMQLSAATT